jgi:hypothetical protein
METKPSGLALLIRPARKGGWLSLSHNSVFRDCSLNSQVDRIEVPAVGL